MYDTFAVPASGARPCSAYDRQKRNPAVTEFVEIPGRGTHSPSTVGGASWPGPR
jgi:hypothetical protein